MNKILLGLGTISITALPVLVFVSCSSTIPTSELPISLLSDRTTITQTVIDKTIIDIETTNTLPETTEAEKNIKNDLLIKNLSNVFLGVNIDNLLDFSISFGGTDAKTIILTGKHVGKQQYIFPSSTAVDKKTLIATASLPPKQTIPISLKLNITQTNIDQAVEKYLTVEDLPSMVLALNIVFDGINENILSPVNNKEILWIVVRQEAPGTITLIAAPDYKFADGSTVLKAKITV